MVRALLAAFALTAALTAASAANAAFYPFRTPSGNINCIYTKFTGEPAYLRCDILSRIRPLPPRPASCPDYVEWGYGYWMHKTGKARVVCAGDTTVDARAKVLGYGKTWSRNSFTCTSRTSGLRCTNASGHGWFLSREHSYKF